MNLTSLNNELKELEERLLKAKNSVDRAILADKIRLKKEQIRKENESDDNCDDCSPATPVVKPTAAPNNTPVDRKDIKRGEAMDVNNNKK